MKFPSDFEDYIPDKEFGKQAKDLIINLLNKKPAERFSSKFLSDEYQDTIYKEIIINDKFEYGKIIKFIFSKKNLFPSNYDHYLHEKIEDSHLKKNVSEGSNSSSQGSLNDYIIYSRQVEALVTSCSKIFKNHNGIQCWPNP